jgi:Dolichyl-phosphate-mannose-protein mannosyltransferase
MSDAVHALPVPSMSMLSQTESQGPRCGWLLAIVLIGYCALTLTYSLLTPAWEANDEPAHTANAEHILYNRSLYPLEFHSEYPIPNRPGRMKQVLWFESHQPPLYYFLLAGWQKLLGIPAFNPYLLDKSSWEGGDPVGLIFSHDYDANQHSQAIILRKLRLLSIFIGLVTVLLCYRTANLAFDRQDIAVSAAAFVAFLPKFNVINAVVTNDGLAVTLSALALMLLLAHLRRAEQPQSGYASCVLPAFLGLVCGAAAITKLNTLPLSGMLLSALCFARLSWARRFAHVALFAACFLLVSGWWFKRNYDLYSDFLAEKASMIWVSKGVKNVIAPVDFSNLEQVLERYLNFAPSWFARGCWYDGSWNQFYPPPPLSWSLLAFAFLCLVLWLVWWVGHWSLVDWRIEMSLLLTILGGVAAILIIAKSTQQAEGRIAYVGLTAFAIAVTRGAWQAAPSRYRWIGLLLWPALLLSLNAYVIAKFVLPFRGL